MPSTRLRWGDTRVSSFPDGRACLVVRYLDPQGRQFEWVPMWSQVQELVDRAANVEVVNKPDSEWLGGLARTVHSVSEKVELHHDAYRFQGFLRRIEAGCLVIAVQNDEPLRLTPAFPLSRAFIEGWLDSYVSGLVINGYVVTLSTEKDMSVPVPSDNIFGGQKFEKRRFRIGYPSSGEAPTELPDIPF